MKKKNLKERTMRAVFDNYYTLTDKEKKIIYNYNRVQESLDRKHKEFEMYKIKLGIKRGEELEKQFKNKEKRNGTNATSRNDIKPAI